MQWGSGEDSKAARVRCRAHLASPAGNALGPEVAYGYFGSATPFRCPY